MGIFLDRTHPIEEEIVRAMEKHGYEMVPLNPYMSDEAKLVILVEEVGEVARAMTYDEGSRGDLQKELLQTAAMAYAWYLSIGGDDAGRSVQTERRIESSASLDWEYHSRSRRSPAGEED